jgi:hypothetical protein
VEAQGELLVDAAVGVDQDVAGAAVDAGERRELDRDPGFLGDLAAHGLLGGLADLDPASGKLPVAVVDPTDEQDLAAALRTAANAAGSRSCARGALGSW